MSWMKRAVEDPDVRREVAVEDLILEACELLCEVMERKGVSRAALARRVGVKPSEITQRLGGERNLTFRSFAEMMDALDFDATLVVNDRSKAIKRAQAKR